MATEENKKHIENILKGASVRPTPVRMLILGEFYKSLKPLSAQEVEDSLGTVDRSSITRALALFAESHILHQISDGSGMMRYELCRDISHAAHRDQHAHFHCRKCGETICLNDVGIDTPNIGTEYLIESLTFVITGICPKCR